MKNISDSELTSAIFVGVMILGFVSFVLLALGFHYVTIPMAGVALFFIMRGFHRQMMFRRHFPAIALLRVLGHPNGPNQKQTKKILISYLNTIYEYGLVLHGYRSVMDKTKPDHSRIPEYIEKVMEMLRMEEKQILLEHVNMMRNQVVQPIQSAYQETIRTRLIAAIKQDIRKRQIEELDNSSKEVVIDKDNPYSNFKEAVFFIRSSKLDSRIKNISDDMLENVKAIETKGGFSEAIKQEVTELIQVDFPNLVDQYKHVDKISSGAIRSSATQAFVEGLERVDKKFKELVAIQEEEIKDNVLTNVNYLKSRHQVKTDDPFYPPSKVTDI